MDDQPRPEDDQPPANGDQPAPVKEPDREEHPLRAWREKHDVTQDVFAERAETTKPTISRVEAGQLEPSFGLMGRITTATKGAVTADACIGWRLRNTPRPPTPRPRKTPAEKAVIAAEKAAKAAAAPSRRRKAPDLGAPA